MKVSVLLPIKRFSASKQRLAPFLSAAVREALALAMTRDVMNALTQAARISDITVLTCDPAAIEVVRPFGVRIIADDMDSGHNRAAAAGIRNVRAAGAANVMMVPIDVPLITGPEIDAVVEAHSTRPQALTIVPSRDGSGTNCTLASPPGLVEPLFGPGSFKLYCDAARAAGADLRVVQSRGLGLDIDTPDDIEMFLRTGRSTHTSAILADALHRGKVAASP